MPASLYFTRFTRNLKTQQAITKGSILQMNLRHRLYRLILGTVLVFLLLGTGAIGAGYVYAGGLPDDSAGVTNHEKSAFDPSQSCSVYIYMCGSNLESKYGLAKNNIDELLEADIPDNTTVLLETGGASRWWSDQNIASDRLQRYVVGGTRLELVEEMENASMGDPDTFSSFLRWGIENYPADRSILVIWDHGGTAADGVCYDENFRYDCLDREELKTAFEAAGLTKKFDLIAFDTCYMGCLETAALVKDYARYMTASQKIIPGGGLNYRVLAESFGKNDDETLGRILCDSFMDKCRETDREKEAQLTFYDLSGTDVVARALNLISMDLRLRNTIIGNTFQIFSAALGAHIGDGTKDVNVVDLVNFMDALSPTDLLNFGSEISRYEKALIKYQVRGEMTDCTGVSVYYPFNYSNKQLEAYTAACPAASYSALLNDIYSGLPEKTITFENAGSIADDGSYEITLSEDSAPYLRGITCKILRESETTPGAYSLVLEGEVDTYDTGLSRKDAKLTVNSTFNGDAVALDGHILMLTVVPRKVTATYSAPVCVNGEDTWYTFVRSKKDGKRSLLSVTLGNGSDEYGLPTRDVRQLQPGDRVSAYWSFDEAGKMLQKKEEFIIGEDGGTLSYEHLPAGRYQYQFIVTDIIGNKYGSDYAFFEIDDTGEERTVQIVEIEKAD